MFNQLLTFLNNTSQDLGLSGWVLFLIGTIFLIVGLLIARGFWRRVGGQSKVIALSTRQNQSDYDLAHRDITKIRQDLERELATHGEFIRRWKRK